MLQHSFGPDEFEMVVQGWMIGLRRILTEIHFLDVKTAGNESRPRILGGSQVEEATVRNQLLKAAILSPSSQQVHEELAKLTEVATGGRKDDTPNLPVFELVFRTAEKHLDSEFISCFRQAKIVIQSLFDTGKDKRT